MADELSQTVPIESPARRPGNIALRDKKNRFAKRPRIVWVEGQTVRGILEDMQMVYSQTSDKDSGVGQKWWRRLLRDDPVKFLETLHREEKRQLGYDEAAAERVEELKAANKRVSELTTKVAELETSLREERAKMTAKLLEEFNDGRQHRAVKLVEKLIDDFRLKAEAERQQSVKAGPCVLCGQKLSPKSSEPVRAVAEAESLEKVAVPEPVPPQMSDRRLSDSELDRLNEPADLSDEDRPKWRAFLAKVKRKERPFTRDEVNLFRKYGSPKLFGHRQERPE